MSGYQMFDLLIVKVLLKLDFEGCLPQLMINFRLIDTVSVCITMQNFIKIGQTVAEILQFFHFQDGRHTPSWVTQ